MLSKHSSATELKMKKFLIQTEMCKWWKRSKLRYNYMSHQRGEFSCRYCSDGFKTSRGREGPTTTTGTLYMNICYFLFVSVKVKTHSIILQFIYGDAALR